MSERRSRKDLLRLPKRYSVSYRYGRPRMRQMFTMRDWHFDVELDDPRARYDGGTAAINVWTHNWSTPETRLDSDHICSFYFNWVEEALTEVEVSPGWELEDALAELHEMEILFLGEPIHGRVRLQS